MCSGPGRELTLLKQTFTTITRRAEAVIKKRILVLVKQGEVAGREPKFVKAEAFDRIVLPPGLGHDG